MDEHDLRLDGNGIAGLLTEVFAVEATSAPRRCQSCGATNPVGAHLAYQGAGTVLRCPACGDVALRVVALGEHRGVRLEGTWMLDRSAI